MTHFCSEIDQNGYERVLFSATKVVANSTPVLVYCLIFLRRNRCSYESERMVLCLHRYLYNLDGRTRQWSHVYLVG